jgi:hypothetical protein
LLAPAQWHGRRDHVPGGSYCKVTTGNGEGRQILCLGSAAGSVYWYTKERRCSPWTRALPSSRLAHYLKTTSRTMLNGRSAATTGCDGKAHILFLTANNTLKITTASSTFPSQQQPCTSIADQRISNHNNVFIESTCTRIKHDT